MNWKRYMKKMQPLRDKWTICYCLKCGEGIPYEASLCSECLSIEFKKMDHGETSGYLYASQLYYEWKMERRFREGSIL